MAADEGAERGEEKTGAAGRAFVEGTLSGPEIKASFHDPGDGTNAPMTLRVKR